MELSSMTLADVEQRLADLEVEVREMQNIEDVEKATEEKKALLERKAELVDLEQRKADAIALENEEVKADKTIETIKAEERNKMTIVELRNSQAYIDAYAEMIKTGKDEEVRSLLTENVAETGTIAIPDVVYDIVKTAWDKNDIMSLVEKANIKGNLKVNFEISSSDAVIHTEGSGAVAEEELVEGIVTIIPAYIKKWISVSDEVMSMRGEAFLNYIYTELTYRITKKMADQLVSIIAALPQVATATSPSAALVKSAPTVGTVAEAVANLSDEASNPVVIMNKLTWGAFKKAQYNNNYGVDVFEGLAVKFNNTLPAYSASLTEGQVYMIVGDLGQGAIANFPNGDAVEFTFDALTRKKEDLVEVLGKEYVGLGVVADKAFALVGAPAQA